MKRYCPKCGKQVERLVKGFCEKCFLEDHNLLELPAEIAVEKCKECGRIKIRERWVHESAETLKQAAKKEVKPKQAAKAKIEIVQLKEGMPAVKAKAEAKIDSAKLEQEKTAALKFVNSQCDSCMKAKSSYFEATLQARFEGKQEEQKKKEVLEKILRILEREQKRDALAIIVQVKDCGKGFDVLIASKRAAKAAAEELARAAGTKIVFSHSVVGMKRDGRKKKRFTFCVRL